VLITIRLEIAVQILQAYSIDNMYKTIKR